jgi:hypothetical protein
VKLLLIDIDGLRSDVFSAALSNDRIPNIAKLVGGRELERGLQIPALAPAPSITFTSQASLFTGAHPSQHGIPGNQFFDRFGTQSDGIPRHYAFDVGDTLAADDAVRVFTDGLASTCLRVPTLYERFKDLGWRSVVAGNMYAKGAQTWLKPSLISIARFTKGGNLFGMSSEEYDRHILDQAIDYINEEGPPEVLTMYFMGLDHESHHRGPEVQLDHLANVIDPMIGDLWDILLEVIHKSPLPMFAIFSDHGQIRVNDDDRHSLRLAFPFEREIGHLFDALGLDVHDFPGEDPDCDAVVASNGGLAHVYLQNRTGRWADNPEFEGDVLRVAKAFWEAHNTGKYASELEGALAGVLVRNVEKDGWYAPYRALTPAGQVVSLEDWFSQTAQRSTGLTVQRIADPVHRLNNLVSPWVGDLLLISNYAEGFYFGAPMPGVHGGLHPEDSESTMTFGFPGSEKTLAAEQCAAIRDAIQTRCNAEGGRQPSTVDLLTGLLAMIK